MHVQNLTKHAISVQMERGEVATFQPSGVEATVAIETVDAGSINGMKITERKFGDVVGLPAPQDDTIYLVSSMVLDRCAGRTDVYAPDSGPTAVRNDKGHVTFVTQLVKAPA